MILSVSRRTDIPCFYSEWFMNRIHAGYVLTRNPMNPAQITRIALSPELVDCIVFWTKDAANLIPQLSELDRLGFRYYFQFTVTPYGRDIEPGLRAKSEIEKTFIALSEKLGRRRVIWRYDPILLGGEIDVAFHKAVFLRMCESLSPYTDTVTVSFVDFYAGRKIPQIRPFSEAEVCELAGFIGETSGRFGIRAAACCESGELIRYGIEQAHCIDNARIGVIWGYTPDIPADKNQRPGCGCSKSIDIGVYNTCRNGCVYCYANRWGREIVQRRAHSHDPMGEFLL